MKIYNRARDRSQWDLASRGDGYTDQYIDATSPVKYGPPRFELKDRDVIC